MLAIGYKLTGSRHRLWVIPQILRISMPLITRLAKDRFKAGKRDLNKHGINKRDCDANKYVERTRASIELGGGISQEIEMH
jgi:hypothetical protein